MVHSLRVERYAAFPCNNSVSQSYASVCPGEVTDFTHRIRIKKKYNECISVFCNATREQPSYGVKTNEIVHFTLQAVMVLSNLFSLHLQAEESENKFISF